MKKSLLAAALIVGFAGAAQAETSVTLYGVVDGGFGYTQFKNSAGDKAKNTGFWDGGQSSNRWGLRGAEDLGDGLQAIFTLESGFSLGTGEHGQNGRMFGREASVGLKSADFGQVKFGRQGNVGYNWLSSVATPFGNNFNQSRAAGAFSAAEIRYDNQIQYQTPSFSGFQAAVGYSFNTDGNQQFKKNGLGEPNVRAWTAGLRYTGGPLAVVLTYDQIKNRNNYVTPNAAAGVSASSWNLAASYDFEVVKLHLGVGLTEDGWLATPSQLRNADVGIGSIAQFNDGFRAYSYGVGLSAPVGAQGKVLAGWTMVDPSRNGNAYGNADLKSQHIFSLAYTYNLSKRTNLYVQGAYGRNLSLVDGNKSQSIGAGLRHSF